MEYVRLGDFCEITSSKRVYAHQYTSDGVPFYRSREIIERREHKDITEELYISLALYNTFKQKFGAPQKGDVLLTSVGTLGIPYLVGDEVFYFKDGNLTWMRNFNEMLLSKYLFYWFNSKFGKVSLITKAIGSSQAALTIDILKKHKIFLPSINVQQAIISILSAYDDLIENNNKRIEILEKMAENLYKEWFVRFRFPGHEQAEFENGIPKGWEYRTIEKLSVVLRRGISPTYDSIGKYTIINQKCIRSSILDMSEAQQQSKGYKSELNLQDGDTVICSTGTGTLGRVGQVYGEYKDTTYDSHVTLIRANQKVGKHFLYWSLKELQPWFMNMGIGSTNQQELYRSTIKNAKILVPSNSDLLDNFEDKIQDVHLQIVLLRDKNKNLTKQRDMLLPRLMSGKLEV